ncbi:MAG: DUF4476 domain-containing protein [Bacteroidota bacterium]|nr:DUF4476 domain-containing protein [Bacteroidota bacterium]
MRSKAVLLTLFLALFIAGKASSQLSVVIFSENGEKFTAFVNGSARNDKPASRVETDRPGGPTFKLRIRFEDNSIPEISKSIFNTPGHDMFYVIRKAANGKYILEKTSSEFVRHNDNEGVSNEKSTQKEEKSTAEPEKKESKPATGIGKGCNGPMDEGHFIASREMVYNAPFDGPKLSQAKNVSDKNCLTSFQISEMLSVFSSESTRLNFAKYAYKHCYDPENYSRVKESLRSSSAETLQQYIDSLK